MKQFIYLLMPAIVLIFLQGCNKDNDADNSEAQIIEIPLTKTAKQLIKSDNDFGFTVFKKLTDESGTDENLMISPLSISLALSMAWNGADGTTKTAMESALGKQGLSIDDVNANYMQLTKDLLSADPKIVMTIANSVWYRNDFEVNKSFIDVNKLYYDAQVSGLDFSNPNTKNIINNWVANKTQNKINAIIDQISAETVMYLINAVYFKGIWKYKFDKSKTSDMPFYLSSGGTKTVKMMALNTDLSLTQNELFTAVELPYGQGNFNMLLFLPRTGKTTDNIIESINQEVWNTTLTTMEITKNVNLKLPKFTFETDKSLNNVLSAMGMEVAFKPFEANFGKINPASDLYISNVKHKSFVEVNEEGTEAAAVTSVEFELTSMPINDDLNLTFDRPFVFVVYEKSTNTLLFIGEVQKP